MSDNKKYYYLKVKENFFEDDSMIVLESMPDGYKYSNILLKLYLRSLKNEGKLMFKDRIPYNSTILAQVTRHSVGDIEKAIHLFKELDLIEMMDNGAIYITDIQNFIGESSTEADRIRKYRKRIDEEKKKTELESGDVTNVRTKDQTNVQQKYTRVRDRVKDRDKLEIELNENEEDDTSLSDEKANADSFEEFWNIYPNKKSKKKASKLFETVIEDKEATFEELIEGAKKYAMEVEEKGTSDKYVKHPTTWLNSGCWADDYDIQAAEETDKRYDNLPI